MIDESTPVLSTPAKRLEHALRVLHGRGIRQVEVAEALGIDSQSLRKQVTKDASKVGFPVIRVGTRTKIPRDAFLKYIGGQ